MGAVSYSLREAGVMMRRRLAAALASVAGIAAALTVTAAFLVLSANGDRLLADWSEVAELSIYLADDITPEQEADLERVLLESRLADDRTRVSKEEAIARFKEEFPDLAGAVDMSQGNPFPASIEVRLGAFYDERATADLAAELRAMPGVADVRYDRLWIERLRKLASFLRWAGASVAVLLAVGSAAMVAHVVRLGLYTRREELGIMELVGAPLSYLRGPFVAEGMLQGAIGAMIALALTWLAWFGVRMRLAAAFSDLVDPAAAVFLPPSTAALLVAGGAAVGAVGGLIASRHTARP
ncbi:MAG: cell division protein FtsX [Vicinamibacterales bacterium]